MLRVQETASGSVLFHQAPPKLTVAGGWFAIVFGCVMIFHPTGWKSGTEQANPVIIFAIGLVITAFGCFLAFLRTTYLVDRSSDLFIKQSRLIVPLRAASYRLSEFTEVAIRKDTDGEGDATYRLLLVAPAHEVKRGSSSSQAALEDTRDAVAMAIFGDQAKPDSEDEEM
jgi:hypothetical protein